MDPETVKSLCLLTRIQILGQNLTEFPESFQRKKNTLFGDTIFILSLKTALFVFDDWLRNWFEKSGTDYFLISLLTQQDNLKPKTKYIFLSPILIYFNSFSRLSTIFCELGIYKGRIFAIKRFSKTYVDITRRMKMELKALKDLR